MGLVVGTLLIASGAVLALGSGAPRGGAIRLVDVWSGAPPGERVIALGLLVFAMTPMARVLALVVIWARERDRRFMALAAIVTAILIAAIVSGVRAA